MRVTANGISFNIQIDGPEGAPWLVFSNSLLTDLTMWDDQAAALKSDFRILRYDQRGHGGTEASAGDYSFDLLVADVITLLDHLSIAKAHFAGLSMGGMTTLFLAQRHPERCERIIACDCGPASTPASAQQWNERIALAQEKGMGALADVTLSRWFSPEFIAGGASVLDKVRGMIVTTPFDGFAGCARALSDFDLRPGLAGIDRPTLMLAGSKDAVLPGTRAIQAAVPGARLIELDAGHLSNLEQPGPFVTAVRDFLNEA